MGGWSPGEPLRSQKAPRHLGERQGGESLLHLMLRGSQVNQERGTSPPGIPGKEGTGSISPLHLQEHCEACTPLSETPARGCCLYKRHIHSWLVDTYLQGHLPTKVCVGPELS